MALSSPKAKVFLHLACGIFIGLALLKFGTPVILDHQVTTPGNLADFMIGTWPIHWAYGLLGLLGLACLAIRRPFISPPLPFLILLGWLIWQFVCALDSVAPALSRVSLDYFSALVFLFLVGLLISPSTGSDQTALFIGVAVGFVCVLRAGIEQHFGGLEATRKYFYTYILPQLSVYPTEYLAKISSNRIFATLFYPNGLAGGILLFLPPLLGFAWDKTQTCRPLVRWGALCVLALPSLACLFWSGSKAGWLILLLQGTVVLFHLPWKRQLKFLAIGIILLVGILGFFIRYQAFFAKGATSVSARMIYWSSAWQIGQANPLTGTGPGTFGVSYSKIKPPDAEMARLTHNDYLQQLSDSGWIGFLAYFSLISWLLVKLYRHSRSKIPFLSLWIGLAGWAFQSAVEFSLYIPALGWGAFFLFGWLWGNAASTPLAAKGRVEPA